MKVTVDRREEGLLRVVLPDGECLSISHKLCPEAKEGDVIVIEVSKEDTMEAEKRISGKLNRLKKTTSDK